MTEKTCGKHVATFGSLEGFQRWWDALPDDLQREYTMTRDPQGWIFVWDGDCKTYCRCGFLPSIAKKETLPPPNRERGRARPRGSRGFGPGVDGAFNI